MENVRRPCRICGRKVRVTEVRVAILGEPELGFFRADLCALCRQDLAAGQVFFDGAADRQVYLAGPR